MGPLIDPSASLEDFIRDRLPLTSVPGVAEVRLYLATPKSGVGRLGEERPYWAYVWGGGLALARHVLDHPELVGGRRVLDLGAGSGLVGIAAALAGASAVLANDTDSRAMTAIKLNAAANGMALGMIEDDLLGSDPPEVDLILAGDVFYDPALVGPVTDFLDRGRRAGIEVLIGDPYRAPLPRERLELVADHLTADFGEPSLRTRTGVFRF